MKLMKLAVAAVFALASTSAYAFHGGGVASCESCHTMHNAKTASGAAAVTKMGPNSSAVYTAPAFLLQGTDPSSTCLSCHAKSSPSSYGVLDSNALAVATRINANSLNYTPGGDFSWLQLGMRKGHNIAAVDYPTINGAPAETRKAPPGQAGTWDGTGFSCVSCHDPHGQSRYDSAGLETRSQAGAAIIESGSYGDTTAVAGEAVGVYRILGSLGWKPHSASLQPALSTGAPVAIAPSTYNKSETTFALGTAPTGQTAVKYASGMSQWCGNCHGAMHGQGSTGLAGVTKHPSGPTATLGALAATYNTYVATGNLNGTNAYDALVPFETAETRAAAITSGGAADVATVAAISASATSNVSCLTCHRAHASGFDSMLRWETTGEGFGIGTSGDFSGANGDGAYNRVAGYYLRGALSATPVYGPAQRNLCNKCHAKD